MAFFFRRTNLFTGDRHGLVACVLPPAVVAALMQSPFIPHADHVVQPSRAGAGPGRVAGPVLPRDVAEAQLPAHHERVFEVVLVPVQVVAANGAPLAVVEDLQVALARCA